MGSSVFVQRAAKRLDLVKREKLPEDSAGAVIDKRIEQTVSVPDPS